MLLDSYEPYFFNSNFREAAMQGYKYPEMSLEQALITTNNAKRETHGAV